MAVVRALRGVCPFPLPFGVKMFGVETLGAVGRGRSTLLWSIYNVASPLFLGRTPERTVTHSLSAYRVPGGALALGVWRDYLEALTLSGSPAGPRGC